MAIRLDQTTREKSESERRSLLEIILERKDGKSHTLRPWEDYSAPSEESSRSSIMRPYDEYKQGHDQRMAEKIAKRAMALFSKLEL